MKKLSIYRLVKKIKLASKNKINEYKKEKHIKIINFG